MAPSSRYTTCILTLLPLLAAPAHAAPWAEDMDLALQRRYTQTYSGCYSSSDGLSSVGSYQYQSTGYCGQECTDNGAQAVLGLTDGADCWCGNELPPASAKVSDSNCNVNCTGYGADMCGGQNFWSVYLTGTESNVEQAGAGSSASSASDSTPTSTAATSATSATTASTTTAAPQTIVTSITPGTTVVVTQPAHAASSSATSSEKSGGSNTAGIAAGVVVGVVAAAALVGGVFYFLRRRQRRMAEEDYKRSTQVNDFMRGTNERKPPGTGYSQASDTRLDPEFGARRNSVGSMADNHDYSRRILRVANPDGN